MPRAKFYIERKCAVCGQLFQAKNIDSIHCSRKCSNIAYNKKRREKAKEEQLAKIAASIPEIREYVSVSEAEALYGVCRRTLYRLIKAGKISYIKLGPRLTRIRKTDLDIKYEARCTAIRNNNAAPRKLYSLEKEDCYTIGEISEKFGISASTVYSNIRKHSIPTRQIGKEVYAPKSEIDSLFS